jgi:hypothetical protein
MPHRDEYPANPFRFPLNAMIKAQKTTPSTFTSTLNSNSPIHADSLPPRSEVLQGVLAPAFLPANIAADMAILDRLRCVGLDIPGTPH